MVLISDGRGNISIFGEEPLIEAQRVAEQLGADSVDMLVIDSARDHSTRPLPRAALIGRLSSAATDQRVPRPRRAGGWRVSRPLRPLPGRDRRGRGEDASRAHGTMTRDADRTKRVPVHRDRRPGPDEAGPGPQRHQSRDRRGADPWREGHRRSRPPCARWRRLLPGLEVVADCHFGCPPEDADTACAECRSAWRGGTCCRATPAHARGRAAHQRVGGPRGRHHRHRGRDQAG